MFVKISSRYFINTNYVRMVDTEQGLIYLAGFPRIEHVASDTISALQVTPAAASYLLACVEAQDALNETAPEQPRLKTRIAQALRYDYPTGLLPHKIHTLFFEFANNSTEIDAAIKELVSENVVTFGIFADDPGRYYHVSNFPKPNPDPSASDEAPR